MLYQIQKIATISDKDTTKVFLASDNNTSKLYVLKEITGMDVTGLYEQFRKISSPLLPIIYDVISQENMTIVLEEYIEGKTLAEKIKEHSLNQTDILYIMDELCEVLGLLHGSNPPIIHRDIKPENMIITPDGNLKLIDIDAARTHKAESDHDTRFLGTRGYASPEQFGYSQTDARSDIYSTGIVFQELLEEIACTPSINKKAQKIIEKSTMFDPKKRYQSISHMRKDIQKLILTKKKLPVPILALSVCTLGLLLAVIILSFREVNPTYTVDMTHKEIRTHSELSTSFTVQCPDDTIIFYLGHPSLIKGSWTGKEQWSSSNPDIATVSEGIVTGWKEGFAEITCTDSSGIELKKWTIAVTTWNDGKDSLTYLDEQIWDYIDALYNHSISVNPQLAQAKINTINDAILYLKAAPIMLDHNSPILLHDKWLWSMNPESVADYQKGGLGDVVNLIAYLLQYDYEDSGFIYTHGKNLMIYNWFYEDGTYYLLDFSYTEPIDNLSYFTDYSITSFTTLNELTIYVRALHENNSKRIGMITMISADNHTFSPALYLSYINDSTQLFSGNAQIGYEKWVYDNIQILYYDESLNLDIIPYETNQIPMDVPLYETRKYYK